MSGGQRCGSGSVDLYLPGLAMAMGIWKSSTVAQSLSAQVMIQASLDVGIGPQRKHVGQNGRMLLFSNLEIGRAVVGSRLGMIKGLMLSRGNRLLKIVGTEVVEQSRPGAVLASRRNFLPGARKCKRHSGSGETGWC